MRIISQDGTLDLPYERFVISVNMQNQGEIIAWTGNHISDDECIVMAVYSSFAKAQKAMEMLHRAYIGMPIIAVKDAEMDVATISDAIRNGFVQPMPLNEQKIECDIFRFPKDEDVEVQDEQ